MKKRVAELLATTGQGSGWPGRQNATGMTEGHKFTYEIDDAILRIRCLCGWAYVPGSHERADLMRALRFTIRHHRENSDSRMSADEPRDDVLWRQRIRDGWDD